jgi:hypothetical protein
MYRPPHSFIACHSTSGCMAWKASHIITVRPRQSNVTNHRVLCLGLTASLFHVVLNPTGLTATSTLSASAPPSGYQSYAFLYRFALVGNSQDIRCARVPPIEVTSAVDIFTSGRLEGVQPIVVSWTEDKVCGILRIAGIFLWHSKNLPLSSVPSHHSLVRSILMYSSAAGLPTPTGTVPSRCG